MRNRTMRMHMAHMPGQCASVQDPDGTLLYTCGVDATLRPHNISNKGSAIWWRADTPVEPDLPDLSVSDLHDKPVTALSITPNGTTLASASVDGFLRLFSITPSSASTPSTSPNIQFVQACARFAGPVRTLDFSPTGAFLAAAGEEPGLLKVVMTAQPTSVNILRAPDSSPANDAISALAFDPIGDFVVTIGERGIAAVWDIDKCVLVRIIDLNERKALSMAWEPEGSALVFGTQRGAVIVSRLTWILDFVLEDAGDADDDDQDDLFADSTDKNEICATAWSPNGRYVLTARKDCNVCLWDIHHKKILGVWKADHTAQAIKWHCKTNAFIIIDSIGQWSIVPDAVPAHMPSPHTNSPRVDLPTIPDVSSSKSKKKSQDDGEDPDDELVVKRSKTAKLKKRKFQEHKKKTKEDKEKNKSKKPASQVSDGEPEDEQNLENGFKFDPSDVDADDEDEVDSESLGSQDSEELSDEEVPGELADLENAGVRLPKLKQKSRSRSQRGANLDMLRVIAAPTPFMPSSTPLSEKKNKKARILAWNLVGAVLSFDESTHDVVEIEFAEATKRTIGIKDHFGYTVGCLSETGVFLGAGKTKDHGAVVSFRPFSSWAQNADWTQFMPPNEDISVIALGQRFTAVATTPNNLVRLFSLSGLQTAVYGVPGNIVTAAGAGDMLAIVFCEEGSTNLKCELLEINSVGEPEKFLYSGGLMMSGGSTLEWLGFTNDTCELCTYDSKGWLWMMCDAHVTKRWVPQVQDAAKSSECDWFWAASATSNQLIGAPCLSNERHPPAKPRPGLRSIPLTAPVIERVLKNGKATAMERFGRTKLSLQRAMSAKRTADDLYDSDDEEVELADEAVARVEVEADKCLLALMEDACKREQNMRALDLVTRMHCKVSFKIAIELAKHFKRTALADRVELVAARKISVIDEDARARRLQSATANGAEAGGLGNSPVSMENRERRIGGRAVKHGDAEDGEEKQVKSRSVRKTTRMEFTDDEEETETVSKAPAATTVLLKDVTDDEEEEEEEEEKEEEAKAEESDKGKNKRNNKLKGNGDSKMETKGNGGQHGRGKKRRAVMPESQQSVKGGSGAPTATTTTSSAKKVKVEVKSEPGGARTDAANVNGRFGASFRNRFLKK